jgi:hypothetical protein
VSALSLHVQLETSNRFLEIVRRGSSRGQCPAHEAARPGHRRAVTDQEPETGGALTEVHQEVPDLLRVYAGGWQDPGYLGWWCGQAQRSAEQPGAVSAAHQDRKAAGVRTLYRGQVDDQLAGGAEQAAELLAQGGSWRDAEFPLSAAMT